MRNITYSPLQISKNNFEKVVDLLLINHDNNNHYCLIKILMVWLANKLIKVAINIFIARNVCMDLKQKIQWLVNPTTVGFSDP